MCDLLPPSPPAEKATARQDQTRHARTSNGAGDSIDRIDRRRIVVSLEATQIAGSAAQDQLGDNLSHTGSDVGIDSLLGLRTEIAEERAEKGRTVVYIEFIDGIWRSPRKANIGDRICERYDDIERRTEKTVRYDEISGRRRRSVGWILRTATGDGADRRVHNRIKVVKKARLPGPNS